MRSILFLRKVLSSAVSVSIDSWLDATELKSVLKLNSGSACLALTILSWSCLANEFEFLMDYSIFVRMTAESLT